jgi:multidrug efflux pump subunit AcrA (membrane-fusion protein)
MKASSRGAVVLVGVAILAVGFWWWRANATADPLGDLLVAEATVGDVQQTVQATGTLRPATSSPPSTASPGRTT